MASIDYVPVATFIGELKDIDCALQQQQISMRQKTYSSCFNNCQHFAATFLIQLHALAEDHPEKSFRPQPMYTEVTNVISEEDPFLWHRPNTVFYAAHGFGVSMGTVAANVASMAAKATVPVPAGGLFGFFGGTVVAPAFYAEMAATSAPLLFAAAAIAGVKYYLFDVQKWKHDTKFIDPRSSTPHAA
jgi:hypothetical protein